MSDLENLIAFYDDNVRRYGNCIHSVAWGSRQSQEKRFAVLGQIGDLKNASVLDVGCGLGDYYAYLTDAFGAVAYTGYDIVPAMVKQARNTYSDGVFEQRNLLVDKVPEQSYDYVFSSGIFNRLVPGHQAFVRDMIRAMFEACRCAIGFNILSTCADFAEPNEYQADPAKLLRECMALSRRVVLRHDYMPHDFTVYIYREESDG